MDDVLCQAVAKYLEWGFTPLPVRDFLKYPAHLRISQKSYSELRAIAESPQSWDSATGVWLLLAEPPREGGYVHVAVDLDVLPHFATLPADVQRAFNEVALNTLAYWTARGLHLHFLVPRAEIPISTRFAKISVEQDDRLRYVADLFIFAPYDDPKFAKSGWRRGVLAYPSAAYDTHSPEKKPVARRLVGTELKPPMEIGWQDLIELLEKIYSAPVHVGSGAGGVEPHLGNITLRTNATLTADGEVLPSNLANTLRILHRYPCVAAVLPTVNTLGTVTAPPTHVVPEGARNNALVYILSAANRLAAPLDVDTLVGLATLVNRYTLRPPLPDREVQLVVQSVLARGYEMRPRTFAERMGLTELCETCPLRSLCYGEQILQKENPVFKLIPAYAHFPSEYFRGKQQEEFYRALVDAVKDPSVEIVLGLAPTGSGKTLHSTGLAAMAVREMSAPAVVLVPTKQLQNQHDVWLSRASVPHVVFKGRANYVCPLLTALRDWVEQSETLMWIGKDVTAKHAPCALGPDCGRYCWAQSMYRDLQEQPNISDQQENLLDRASTVIRSFEDALSATVVEFVAAREEEKRDKALVELAKNTRKLMESICEFSQRCGYLSMKEALVSTLGGSPGVIVANQSLSFVARSVAHRRADADTPTLIILDEAHKIVDAIFEPFRLRYISRRDIDIVTPILRILEQERQLAEAALKSTAAELRAAVRNRDRAAIRRVRARHEAITNHLRRLDQLIALVRVDPDAFIIDTASDEKHAYIRVLKNRRANVLRKYLLTAFPNSKFVLLTATGSELKGIADKVIAIDDVIPPQNRPMLFIPVRKMSASALRDRAAVVYTTEIAPLIVAQYNMLAPRLARVHHVDPVRGIVHEVAKTRALLLARALSSAGYDVLVYAGRKEDLETSEELRALHDAAVQSENIAIEYSLETAVARFKKEKRFTFFVSVALETGHDFDDDDIMLQWVVKVPYPRRDDIEYVMIEQRDGKDARDRQYYYDTLMQIIQMAGRTTRRPDQYSMTIILDSSFALLLKRAWEFGFREEVESLAERLVIPEFAWAHLRGLPKDLLALLREKALATKTI